MSQYSEDLTPDRLTVVTPPSGLSETPQFATAEYAHLPGTERCRICNNLISGEYYRVNNQMACATCAQQASAGQPIDSHAAFLRGLLFAIGGAVIGLTLYATVAIVTGWTIGYLGLAVGWLVGKGMIKGSNGLGGRRYQIAAVLLTYAAISMAAVPVGISYAIKHENATASKHASGNSFPGDFQSSQPAPVPKPQVHAGALLGQLAIYGLASPFLEFKGNVGGAAIGLFILFIGLRIAWTMTGAKPLAVDGPYSAAAA
jgi:hypothetical protein